jgi:hypothetical protein
VKLKDIPTPTLITGGAVVLWLGTFVLRSINPEFTGGPAADALMATVVAWWAKTRATTHGEGDLISEVLTKNVLPLVSPPPKPGTPPPSVPPKPPPAYTPAPYTPKPYTPKPTAPTKGGMPWS